MKTIWTQGVSTLEDKENLERSLMNSKWAFDRLSQILTDMDNSLDRQERSPSAYDNANWAYRQAHMNGYRQCLYKIKDLINLDLKDTTNDPRELTPS